MQDGLPETQRAVILDGVVEKAEGLDACLKSDAEVPGVKTPLGPRQVLVRNEYAGVNFIDTYFRTGLYPKAAPFGLGQEGAGEVVGVGSEVPETFTKLGDRVVYLGNPTYCEYSAVDADMCYAVPEGVALDDLLTLAVQGLTAQYLACETYPLSSDKVCLVQAAAGGTGQILVQIAKALGATVIGTCSSGKVEVAKSVGCDLVLPYDELSQEEVVKRVKEATDGKGVHVAYDGVGKKTYKMSMQCIRKRGMLVVFGNASGATPPIDPLELTAQGSIYLTRPSLYGYLEGQEDLKRRMDMLVGWIKDGSIKVTVQEKLALEQASKAHHMLESGATKGKLLLTCNKL
ncbi:Alcohol dehydrogenase 1 [Hondaea fermentalgiana]|uniref:Probable quinone oxidoreductase n=1 Tax=Hondaea fermentalgiana TaxID=2315210 RepID=A0A2R5G6C4_9STRA|nr:Alcohol dehydrogenase 1 [Hondaea fermentalgiana]|eukprot:GBG23993.1 Alcohol dehydrogenase 1 [Hondaea fermentalgiana]